MNRSPQRRGFLYFAGPLFLYWIIEFGAQMIGELFVMIPHAMEIVSAGGGSLEWESQEQMQEAMLYAVSGGDHDICGPLHNSADLVPVSERA